MALPVDYIPATSYPTYGTGTAMPPSTNGSVPQTDYVPVQQADGSVVYLRKRRRRRRRKLLTASDRGDIAFLVGTLTGATQRAAISAILSRRC